MTEIVTVIVTVTVAAVIEIVTVIETVVAVIGSVSVMVAAAAIKTVAGTEMLEVVGKHCRLPHLCPLSRRDLS